MQMRENETKFPVEVDGVTLTLVDLLGKNETGRQQYRRVHGKEIKTKLPQAFQTAGHKFEAISNDYKVSIVVPYNDEAKQLLDELSQVYLDTGIKKRILRKLQRYTVGISESRKTKLGNAIYESCNREVLILSDGYYDKEVGIVDEPRMEFQCM